MPTLHLIDADSSQACPAVLALMNETFNASRGSGDRVLLLGGDPLRRSAEAAGITDPDHLAVPFGKAPLDLFSLKRWLRNRPAYDRVCCGSIGALHAAARQMPDVYLQLTLAHTPTAKELRRLHRLADRNSLRINTPTQTLRDRLVTAGLSPKAIDVTPTKVNRGWIKPGKREALRAQWQIDSPRRQVVALLSDHPGMVSAIDAAALTCLTRGTRTDGAGDPAGLTLLVHPDQTNRLRSQDFLAAQDGRHRVVHEPRLTQPWNVLPGCDAALALGPDAGGVSLFWAFEAGTPIIAPPHGPAKELTTGKGPVLLSRSSAHKDLAYELHRVMAVPAGLDQKSIAQAEEPGPQPATIRQ